MCCAMEYLHRKLIIDSQVAADRKTKKNKQKNKTNQSWLLRMEGVATSQQNDYFPPLFPPKYIYIYI